MKTLLEVRKDRGQDYTSFCNEIKDKALFADADNVNADKLLIAVLVKGIDETEDVQKLLESEPKTFEEARITLLKFECARNSARTLKGKREVGATRRTEYSKNKFAGKKPDNRKPDVKPQVKLWECQVCEKKHQQPFCCKDCKKPHHPPCSPF